MKKIISGKMYNPETARKIGEWWNGQSGYNYIVEAMYCKRTGEYFLYALGGANTQYAKPAGQNCWVGSEKIIPLTLVEAQEWGEIHLDADEYEAVFGPVKE